MSKYSEALEMFCNATAVFKEENGMLVMVAHNDNLRKETSILEEAISKAEKYDAECEINAGYMYFSEPYTEIKRLEKKNQELKEAINKIRQKYKDLVREFDCLVLENDRLEQENEELKDIQKLDKNWHRVLYKENQILIDGVKVLDELEISLLEPEKSYSSDGKLYSVKYWLATPNGYIEMVSYQYNKIKAMIEVVNNE